MNGSLWLARLFAISMILLLIWLYTLLPLGMPFLVGITASAALLAYEHWLLRNGDLTKLDLAFFTMNGYISVIIFAGTTLDLLVRRAGI